MVSSFADALVAIERATESRLPPSATETALLSATDVFSDTLRAFESATDALVVAVEIKTLWLVSAEVRLEFAELCTVPWEVAVDKLTEITALSDTALLSATDALAVAVEISTLCDVSLEASADVFVLTVAL